jgi:hypothetical protein
MAKIKRQLFGLSGRLGDEVYVHRPGHKDYVRRSRVLAVRETSLL